MGGEHSDEVTGRLLETHPQLLWRRHSDAVHAALIRRWLPAPLGSILKTDLFDEAAGVGLTPVLAGLAERVVGIDVSPSVVRLARERHAGLEALEADVRALPFEEGEFDAVVSNSTLDHFDSKADIVAGLRELHRVLRPEGTLVLTLDNPWNPVVGLSKLLPRRRLNRAWIRVGEPASRAGLFPYYVGETLDVRRAQAVLAELGFAVAAVDAIVHAPRALAVVVASLLERHTSPEAQARFLRMLGACERLGRLPTRYVTGHLTAVKAVRR